MDAVSSSISVWNVLHDKLDTRTVVVLLILLLLIFICLIPKVIFWLISRKLEKAYNISLKIGSVGFFIGHNIRLEFPNNLVLEINCAQLKNLLFLRSVGRLCSLHVGDVRLHCSYETLTKVTESLGNRAAPSQRVRRKDDGFLLTAFQFVIVHINEIAIVVSEVPGCDCLLMTTLRNIRLHPTFDAAQLRFHSDIESLGVKILSTRPESVLCGPGGTLLNFSMSCSGDLALYRNTPSKIRQVGCNVNSPRIFITEDLLPELESLSRLAVTLRRRAPLLEGESRAPAQMWQRLPNGMSLVIDTVQCEIVRFTLNKSLKVTWRKFTIELTRSEEQASVLSLLTTLNEFDTQSDLIKFARVEKLQINCQISSTALNTHVKLEHPLFTYNHEELTFWSSLMRRFLVPFGVSAGPRPIRGARAPHAGWLRRLASDRRLCLKLEVNPALRAWHGNPDGQLVLRLLASETLPGLEVGLKALHLTFETESLAPVEGEGTGDSPLSSFDLYWEISTMYCKLMESDTDISEYHDRIHYWQTVLYLGNIFMWSHKLRLGGMLSHVQLEWSRSLSARLCDLLSAYARSRDRNRLKQGGTGEVEHRKSWSASVISLLQRCEFDVKLNHTNAYLVSEHGVFVMQRLDLVHLQSISENRNSLIVKGTSVSYIRQVDKGHPVVSSDEVTNPIVAVKEICANQESKNFSVHCAESLVIRWKPALHLCLVECFRATYLVMESVRSLMRKGESQQEGEPRKEDEERQVTGFWSNRFALRFAGIELHAELNESHRLAFILADLRGRFSNERVQWVSPHVAIRFDQHNIFVFTGADLRSNHHAEEYRKYRNDLSVLKTKSNRAWEFQCDEWLMTFPYKYNFYECFDAMISVRKFLRKLHASGKDPFSADKPLAADYIIRAKDFIFQVNDDPFEVKLGDNYALLSDEMVQREIRYEKLRNRMDRKDTSTFYSEHTRDHVHRQMEHLHTQIYVQRHGKLYERHPRREALFTWSIRDMKLVSFADEALHGRANVIAQLKDIDAASPYPPEGLDFTTLWCRFISLNLSRWTWQLRDYPSPMWDIEDLHLWGRFAAAENTPAPRAMRHVFIDPGAPWPKWEVIRCMPPLKFYHDFTADLQNMMQCYGPCWEPCFAWLNLSLDLINRPSRDPSPPMPWWDKVRLKLHGNLVFHAERMSWVYPTSLDPYNETEFMDWTWSNVLVEWTNMKWLICGDLDILCRTASKYDDCRLFHMPKLELIILLNWICDGDPNNHHAVMPCAPDKVPDSRVPYDSFRMFRTRKIDMTMMFTIRPSSSGGRNLPECLFYTNILKFFDKFKMCLAKVSRPIRRGQLFECLKPKKALFSRLFRHMRFRIDVPSTDLCYWVSSARKQGLKLCTGPVVLDMTLRLELKPFNDDLKRRHRADWSVRSMTASTSDIRIWLTAAATRPGLRQAEEPHQPEFMQLSSVIYERNEPADPPSPSSPCRMSLSGDETEGMGMEDSGGSKPMTQELPSPVHRVEVRDIKIRWTADNRNLVYRLIDNYRSRKSLKKNLSAQALRAFKVDGSETQEEEPRPSRARLSTEVEGRGRENSVAASLQSTVTGSAVLNNSNCGAPDEGCTRQNRSQTVTSTVTVTAETDVGMIDLLEQLVKEVDSGKFIVDCEKTPKQKNILDQLHGYALCCLGDVLQRNWHVDFRNCQVVLKAAELSGYVIVSAAHAHLDALDSRPVWKGAQLLTKSTLVGRLERMQYYATVEQVDPCAEDVWLDENDVMCPDEEDEDELSGRPEIVGCSRVVGGVVSACVGHSGKVRTGSQIQLQRIISRCQCEVFYVSYDPADANLVPQEIIPPLPSDDKEVFKTEEGVDTLTLLHHNLNVCTNTLQYHMIVDLVNDLLLYVEPQRKAALERLRIQLSLLSEDTQKMLILRDQEELRVLSRRQRELERTLYYHQRKGDADGTCSGTDHVTLERAISSVKERIHERNLQLTQRISSYQQFQVQKQRRAARARSPGQDSTGKRSGGGPIVRNTSGVSSLHGNGGAGEGGDGAAVIRRNEVCFEHARWRLTEEDGQIGIADLELRGFLYSKVNQDDDSGAHHFELGWIKVENLLPNSFYREVLIPNSDLFPSDSVALRIMCVEKAPVGGIPIKEHLEVNIVPLNVQITKQFYRSMMLFFFPGRAANGASSHSAPAVSLAEGDGPESGLVDSPLTSLSLASSGPTASGSVASAPVTMPTTPSIRVRALHRKKRSAESEDEWLVQAPGAQAAHSGSLDSNGPMVVGAAAMAAVEKKGDVVETMRERARNNNVFLYIKIPEIPIRFSYKGEKPKNMVDFHDFHLTVPMIEYHNETWTWLDVALAVKSIYRKHLLAQAIRQKLKLRPRFLRSEVSSPSNPNEEEEQIHKLKVIFGTKLARQTYGIKKKRSLFRRNSKS